MAYRAEYADVPDFASGHVDPHWLELQRGSALPSSYLPTMVRGEQALWRRVAALVLIVMLLAATAGGICLTYGPQELFRLLES